MRSSCRTPDPRSRIGAVFWQMRQGDLVRPVSFSSVRCLPVVLKCPVKRGLSRSSVILEAALADLSLVFAFPFRMPIQSCVDTQQRPASRRNRSQRCRGHGNVMSVFVMFVFVFGITAGTVTLAFFPRLHSAIGGLEKSRFHHTSFPHPKLDAAPRGDPFAKRGKVRCIGIRALAEAARSPRSLWF